VGYQREYAARAGLNAGTLSYWKWRLSKDAPEAKRAANTTAAKGKREVRKPRLVELAPVSLSDERMEIELSSGHKLRLPAHFDPASVTRLLSVLGGAS
jgi:transposase-like protein